MHHDKRRRRTVLDPMLSTPLSPTLAAEPELELEPEPEPAAFPEQMYIADITALHLDGARSSLVRDWAFKTQRLAWCEDCRAWMTTGNDFDNCSECGGSDNDNLAGCLLVGSVLDLWRVMMLQQKHDDANHIRNLLALPSAEATQVVALRHKASESWAQAEYGDEQPPTTDGTDEKVDGVYRRRARYDSPDLVEARRELSDVLGLTFSATNEGDDLDGEVFDDTHILRLIKLVRARLNPTDLIAEVLAGIERAASDPSVDIERLDYRIDDDDDPIGPLDEHGADESTRVYLREMLNEHGDRHSTRLAMAAARRVARLSPRSHFEVIDLASNWVRDFLTIQLGAERTNIPPTDGESFALALRLAVILAHATVASPRLARAAAHVL